MRTLESNGIFLEISDDGFSMYMQESSVKKKQKDFMSAVFFFMKKNFLPASFWKSVLFFEKNI
jgi:hypothetical protein